MKGLESLSDVERLKILKSIRIGSSSEEEFEQYVSLYSGKMGNKECKRRLNGYFLEDEFALLCFLMESCTSLIPLGQSPVNNQEMKIPDYIASFKLATGQEFKCFIEVKTSNSLETKKISNTMLDNYLKFSNKFNLPLLFASRIQEGSLLFWVIQTEDEFRKNGRKTKIDYLTETSGPILLHDYFLAIANPLKIQINLTKEPKTKGIRYSGNRYVSGIKISQLDSENNEIISLDLKKEELIYDLLLGCFQHHDIESGNELILIKTIPKFSLELISSLLLKLNEIVSHGDGRMNASRLLAKIENGEKAIINISWLYNAFISINKKFKNAGGKDIFGILFLGDEQTRERKLKELIELMRKQ